MAGIYEKTRELSAGSAGSLLSESHLTAHQNIEAEINDISTALSEIVYTPPTAYTPVLYGGTVAGSGTYTNQKGEFTQLGKYVFFAFVITITNHTGSGTARITLPVNSGTFSESNIRFIIPLRYTSFSSGDDVYDMIANVGSNASYCDLYQVGVGKAGVAFQLENDVAFTVLGSGFYRVS